MTITYSFADKNYAVDPTKIDYLGKVPHGLPLTEEQRKADEVRKADLLRLTELATSGTKADLQEFVTILNRYPDSYKIIPSTPPKPEGPYGLLDDDVLDALGLDITSIIADAMLLCLQVQRELRKMGLEMSLDQIAHMVAKMYLERDQAKAANKSERDASMVGAGGQIGGAVLGGAGGIVSFSVMAKGDKTATAARLDQDRLKQDQQNLAKARAGSDTAFDSATKKIEDRKTKLAEMESEVKKTRDEVSELRDKVLSDKNDPNKRAADDAIKARLERADEELKTVREDERKTAKALERLDETGRAPEDGVDADIYRLHLQNQHALQKDALDERDALVNAAAKDHPAAVAPALQRDREVVRADIASKQDEKTALEKTLADIQTRKTQLGDELEQQRSSGKTIGFDELKRQELDARELVDEERQVTKQLDTRNAQIASLRLKEEAIGAKLDGLVPAAVKIERQALVDGVKERTARIESLKDEKAKLESQIESKQSELAAAQKEVQDFTGPPAHLALAAAQNKRDGLQREKDTLVEDLVSTTRDIKQETDALHAQRNELESNDYHKVCAAESRVKEKEAETATLRSEVKKEQADLLAERDGQNKAFDAKQKQIEADLQVANDKVESIKASVERAAAWRTSLDCSGRMLGGFMEIGKAELTLVAADGRADAQFTGREYEIYQIAHGIVSSFSDNMLSGIGESRQCMSTTLIDSAKQNQTIAQKF